MLLIAVAACAGERTITDDAGTELPATCNGHEVLCTRPFDQVAFATTHNAMSSLDAGWLFASQRTSVPTQLGDGVRGLMLDTHDHEGVAHLCHGICEAGRTPLVDGLAEIATYLAANRDAVLTLIFEAYITAEATKSAFEASGLSRFTHAQRPGDRWPTLGEMVAADHRLVVFTDREGGRFDWYHDVWAFAFETHLSNSEREDLSCAPNRGSTGNDLFILNHFLTNPVASERWAEQLNHNPFFIDRSHECEAAFDHIPNFVAVDFYTIGDVLSVVDTLNLEPR